jgi:uncharacterized membrane protein
VEFLLFGLVVALVPFVMPFVAWVSARRTRARVEELEAALDTQRATIDQLAARIKALQREISGAPAATPKPAPAAAPQPPPTRAPERAAAPPPPKPEPVAEKSAPPIVPKTPPRETPAQPAPAAVHPKPSTPPPPPTPPAPPEEPPSWRPAIDWESLVGVKLFSAIAGVALVIAAIFFLRYSI